MGNGCNLPMFKRKKNSKEDYENEYVKSEIEDI